MAGPGPGEGLTFAQLRARVQNLATFAESDLDVDTILYEKHREMLVESGWDRRYVQLATTVVDQGEYDLDAQYAEVLELSVDGAPYDGEAFRLILAYDEADARLGAGQNGIFSDYYKADGTQQFAIRPKPTKAGLSIMALVSHDADNLTANDYPLVPRDFHSRIADGTIAEFMRLRQDMTIQDAEVFEQRFQQAIGKLQGRRNARGRGRVTQIMVRGRHI